MSVPAAITYESCSTAELSDSTTLAYSTTAVTITLAQLQTAGGDASDNCNIAAITYQDATDGNTCPEVITRTFTVTDDCNNSTILTQTITIDDTQDPILSVSAAITYESCSAAELSDSTTAYSTTAVTITLAHANCRRGCFDNCNIAITYQDATDGNTCQVLTRTFTVTDDCNNSYGSHANHYHRRYHGPNTVCPGSYYLLSHALLPNFRIPQHWHTQPLLLPSHWHSCKLQAGVPPITATSQPSPTRMPPTAIHAPR